MTTTCSLIFKLPADYRVLVYLKLIYPRQFTVPKQREAIIFHTVLSRRVTKERFLKSRRSIPRCCACRRWVTLESSAAECTTRHVLTTLSPALSEFAKTTKREIVIQLLTSFRRMKRRRQLIIACPTPSSNFLLTIYFLGFRFKLFRGISLLGHYIPLSFFIGWD